MNADTGDVVREPAVAGRFYPGSSGALSEYVSTELARTRAATSAPLAVIAPHAGYRYSGQLAARALGATRNAAPTTVAIVSPSHHHVFHGIGLPSQSAFRTPAGIVGLDIDACQSLRAASLAHTEHAAHDREHGVEVLLPFIQELHPGARIVPLVTGHGPLDAVSRAIDHLSHRRQGRLLFVLSSDLSHFLHIEAARSRDAATARKIEAGDAATLGARDACGFRAISGFLQSRTASGARIARLGITTSLEANGQSDRTVGYGAWSLLPADAEILCTEFRHALLSVARRALASRLEKGLSPDVDAASFPAPLQTHAASFVTLEHRGRLRGCIGSLAPRKALVADVV